MNIFLKVHRRVAIVGFRKGFVKRGKRPLKMERFDRKLSERPRNL